MICIGIDPGTHTGLAVWDTRSGRFLNLETLPIHQAMDIVRYWNGVTDGNIQVVFEDARQRKWFGRGDVSAKAQGAGSAPGLARVTPMPRRKGQDLSRGIVPFGRISARTTESHIGQSLLSRAQPRSLQSISRWSPTTRGGHPNTPGMQPCS